MSNELKTLKSCEKLSLYGVSAEQSQAVRQVIASTPESRAICNDPFVAGVNYTRSLQTSCAAVLNGLSEVDLLNTDESSVNVFHILRGGLNFGLREAVSDAFGWNNHRSSFTSAQRFRQADNSWDIKEADYQKFSFSEYNDFVFGDVVATGTTLKFALDRLIAEVCAAKQQIRSLTFFTIGAPCCFEILSEASERCQREFEDFRDSTLVFFEGIFSVANESSPLRIKIDGTDLIRRDALLAPEFIESQYESPAYPLERCAIYDAGSRSFDTDEYFEDVKEYWQQVLSLAESGITYQELLSERFPELDSERYDSSINLVELARNQLHK